MSQFPLRRIGLKPTGRKTATRSSYADARFVNRSRSSVTDAGASRHMTSTTTGLASVVDAAPFAGGHSPSFRCSHCLTRHYSLPARCHALQRRFAEQCSWEKALPKLKDSDRLPDPSTVRRWSSGLDCFQLALSFLNLTVIRVAHWLARGHQAADHAGPPAWITPALQLLWPLRL